MNWITYLKPAVIFISVIIAGLIIRKILFLYLKKITEKTETNIDDIVTEAIKNPFMLWCVIIGISVTIKTMPVADKTVILADKILISLWIISFTLVVAKIIGGVINIYITGKEGAMQMPSLTQNVARWAVIIVGFLILLEKLGISIAPIITALGVGGLAVALALQDTLSNLFAGFHITLSKQIKVGDYIKLEGGQEGYVFDIGWRNTEIRELSNNIIMIPNSKLSQTIVTNYYIPEKDSAILIEVGVDYSSDLEKVENVTVEVAKDVLKTVAGGAQNFEPFIRYHTFSNSSINFSVILRGKEFTDKFLITHEFIKRLKVKYDKENITIPFPITTVHLAK
ncbi:MAG: mechanosensitive ion channel protein MscS [Elusimicrobia bacterium CG06_land_8_20_14_3_00_38_11]|nr:MAG: mechanosensitive ion channel protein MscS [Elusimicrobia bacterium CG06_land_8_20_14_3_00_38_11]